MQIPKFSMNLGISFFAREHKAFAVATCALVDVRLAVGKVLQVLDGLSTIVGYPAGTAQMVGVIIIDIDFRVVMGGIVCLFPDKGRGFKGWADFQHFRAAHYRGSEYFVIPAYSVDASRIVAVEPPAKALVQAAGKQVVGPARHRGIKRRHRQPPASGTGAHPVATRIVVLGIAFVTQHHVGGRVYRYL